VLETVENEGSGMLAGARYERGLFMERNQNLGANTEDAQQGETLQRPRRMDFHVANRLRLRRAAIGMTQTELAERSHVSYQQIQKYEKGISIVSASRLLRLAQTLSVTVEYFFEDAEAADHPSRATREPVTGELEGRRLLQFVRSRDGIELNRAFAKITEPRMRRAIVELARAASVRPR
jgi:transcriptional regulator with XRE-family HTH domain